MCGAMTLSLREITAENWRQICALEVAESQKDLVAPNWYSLLQAVYGFTGELAELHIVPRAIYAADEPVGFLMYNTDAERERFFIMRVMVDQKAQSRGYARAALEQLLEQFLENPCAKEVGVSYISSNRTAERLYLGLGFEQVGLDEEGREMIAVRNLNPQREPWQSLWRKLDVGGGGHGP
jgi:diamine N-acetyltransferase